jgi:hypothetical protein
MPRNAERQLARLRARFAQAAHELAQAGFILRGTILQRYTHCGSPGCACHSDPAQMHGPYWQWTSKIKGKTVTRARNEAQVRRARAWMENAKRFDRLVAELQELSAEADAILREEERAQSPPGKTPRRRAQGKRTQRRDGKA